MQENLKNISGSRLFFANLTFSWLASKIIDVRNQAIVMKNIISFNDELQMELAFKSP